MLTLPPKPCRTILLETHGMGEYTITFLLPDTAKEIFDELIRDYVSICLSGDDAIMTKDWVSSSAKISVRDVPRFVRDLQIRGFTVREQ